MEEAFSLPGLKLILVDLKRGLSAWDYPDCSAPFWRLYWNASGRGLVRYGGRAYVLEGRALLLIPPETAFSTRAESPMDHLYAHFLAAPPFDRAKPGVFASAAASGELAALRALRDILEGRPARPAGRPPREERAVPLEAVLRAASLCYGRLALFPGSGLGRADDSEEIAGRVAASVRAALPRAASNAELARALGMSVPSLERAMRDRTGRSLHAFSLWVRIGEACIRLRHTGDSIDEIAEALGFSDRSHFSRTFARLRGEGPAAYRASSP